MNPYDPAQSPDPGEWLSYDEQARINMVMDYHRQARIRLPNPLGHATIHVIVENQIAEGPAIPAKETLSRIMNDGLDRHDAIHAIGSILDAHLHEIVSGTNPDGDPNARSFWNLRGLTAAKWKATTNE